MEPDPSLRRFLLGSAGALYGVLLIGAMLWSYLRTGRVVPETLWRGRTWESLGLGLLLAAAVILVSDVVMRRRLLHWFAVEVRTLLGPVDWSTALYLALLSGVGEEILFRGVMQPAIGYVATSLIFGLVHIGPDRRYLVWTAFAVVMGVLLGGTLLITGSLVGPLVAHVLINAVNLRRIGRLELPAD